MNIYFPNFYTEAHRKPGNSSLLIACLATEGIICSDDPIDYADAILCGSIYQSGVVREDKAKFSHLKNVPVIQYNWDIYPWQVEKHPNLWLPYFEELKKAKDVWVPSECTRTRTKEFAGVDSFTLKTSIRPWDPGWKDQKDLAIQRGQGYVVDVMRKYPDRNIDLVRNQGKVLSIPVIETATTTPWPEFKKIIAGARALVSAYDEASTGGLTLLEGYWHGVPVLLSNSPRHGGVDYFRDRASYFEWDDPASFREALWSIWTNPPKVNVEEARAWITQEYSEEAFAKRIAKRLREIM